MAKQVIIENHATDDQGNPAGGVTSGRGISIIWQNGPIGRDAHGVQHDANGAFVEAVIQAAIGRLEFYQRTKFQCVENASAIDYLKAALNDLEQRTKAREERGVEGTHTV